MGHPAPKDEWAHSLMDNSSRSGGLSFPPRRNVIEIPAFNINALDLGQRKPIQCFEAKRGCCHAQAQAETDCCLVFVAQCLDLHIVPSWANSNAGAIQLPKR